MYEKLVPGRLFSHQVLQSNEMDVPNGYDEAPFSGSSTSTLSTPLLNCESYMSADNAHQAENSATTTETRLEQVPVDNSASASGSGTNSSSSRLLNVTNMRDVKEQEQVVTRMAVARQFFIAHEYKPPPQTQAERFMATTTRAQTVILHRHLNSTMRQTRRLRRWTNSSNFKKHFEFTAAHNELPIYVRLNTDTVIEALTNCGTPYRSQPDIPTSRWPVENLGYAVSSLPQEVKSGDRSILISVSSQVLSLARAMEKIRQSVGWCRGAA